MAKNEEKANRQPQDVNGSDTGNQADLETPDAPRASADQSAVKTDPGPSEGQRPEPGQAGQQAPAPSPDAPDEVKATITALVEAFPSLEPFHKEDQWTEVVVPAELLKDVARFVRDDERLQLNFLSSLSGVDYQDDGLQVVYHLISIPDRKSVV